MDDKRNEKGQFEKGYSGGPGRGYKKERQVELDGELFDDIEKVVRECKAGKDANLRLKAATLGVRLEDAKKRESKDQPLLGPITEFNLDFVATYITRWESKTGEPYSGKEAMRIIFEHLDTCPDSPFKRYDFLKEIEDNNL